MWHIVTQRGKKSQCDSLIVSINPAFPYLMNCECEAACSTHSSKPGCSSRQSPRPANHCCNPTEEWRPWQEHGCCVEVVSSGVLSNIRPQPRITHCDSCDVFSTEHPTSNEKSVTSEDETLQQRHRLIWSIDGNSGQMEIAWNWIIRAISHCATFAPMEIYLQLSNHCSQIPQEPTWTNMFPISDCSTAPLSPYQADCKSSKWSHACGQVCAEPIPVQTSNGPQRYSGSARSGTSMWM